MKHTKGKWEIHSKTFTEITVHTKQMDICTVLCIDISDEEAEANANLIASAPDLLEACEYAVNYLPDGHRFAKEKLQQAINKAKENIMRKGKNYGYNKIESFADEFKYEIEELGRSALGESFLILRRQGKDEVISFVLSGGADNQYVYECIYSDLTTNY